MRQRGRTRCETVALELLRRLGLPSSAVTEPESVFLEVPVRRRLHRPSTEGIRPANPRRRSRLSSLAARRCRPRRARSRSHRRDRYARGDRRARAACSALHDGRAAALAPARRRSEAARAPDKRARTRNRSTSHPTTGAPWRNSSSRYSRAWRLALRPRVAARSTGAAGIHGSCSRGAPGRG